MEDIRKVEQELCHFKKLCTYLAEECRKLESKVWVAHAIECHRHALVFKNKQLEKELEELRNE